MASIAKAAFLSIAVFIMLTAGHGQAAAGMTVGELFSSCKKVSVSEESQPGAMKGLAIVSAIHCMAFIEGLVEGYSMREALGDEARDIKCLPKESTTGRLLKLFVKTVENMPQTFHQPAGTVVLPMLSIGFPCEQ